jgi:sterol desaturase/sphingolipid hydroxylase (fatty acid hydroxylase superfamily)
MPTPLEILLDPISLAVIAIYAALLLWEMLAPGRVLPFVRGWKMRGLSAFALYFCLSSYLPLLWGEYLEQIRLFDLSGLGATGGAILGLLLLEFATYLWHRTMHRLRLLWRVFHQMHHSAERLDAYGAFYFSPFDMLGFIFLGSICLVLVLGVTPQAATIVLLATTFMRVFQHANIRTPHWLGYVIQRPESHTVHHGRGIHAYNYANLPVFDIVFDTFRNPVTYENRTGFYPGASSRVADMLLFKDINKNQPERPQALTAG